MNPTNSTTRRRTVIASGVLAALALVALLATASGGALAATNQTTIANDTLAVDDSTQSVYVEGFNTTQSIDVTLYGQETINGSVSETQLTTHTINATGAGSSQLWAYDAVNTTTYDHVRVHVAAASNLSTDASVDVGEISKVSGGDGGGLFGGGSSTSLGIGVVVVLVVGLLFLGGDD